MKTIKMTPIEAFVELGVIVNQNIDTGSTFVKVLQLLGDLTGARRVAIFLLDATKRRLYTEKMWVDGDIESVRGLDPIELNYHGNRNSPNLLVYSAVTGKSIALSNIYKVHEYTLDWYYHLDKQVGERTEQLYVAPIVDKLGNVAGVMVLSDISNELFYRDEGKQILSSFASYASMMIENQRYRAENSRLIRILEAANRDLHAENKALKKNIDRKVDREILLASSKSMRSAYDLVDKVSRSAATVMISGETGTGKEHIARLIHDNSERKGAYITQNCAALPENLLESELFGYKKGAFSGADKDKPGLIAMADGGTLFLDEVAELSLPLQAKLLRVIQEGELRALGATTIQKVNVRYVAASHKNLTSLVSEGEFREDLYYRLNIFPIHLPPLRDRKEDILPLAKHFVEVYAESYSKVIKAVSPKYYEHLEQYSYPGNIRELKNIVERGVILVDDNGSLTVEHLPDIVRDSSRQNVSEVKGNNGMDGLKQSLEHYEAALIIEKLQQHHWNQSQAAIALGIGRRTLIDKINRYQISRPQ
ncbi:MAG: sigma-54-dependent Fis family transcriptional regulator [Gammaproteobacteria bacterium]|nr:sigma-54-dependent Fis family transcriptional regulator [Gammaproteobacteria bacterium]